VLIDSLTRTRDFELASGALADARQAVQDLDAMRNSDKPLVRYRGGAFRVKDLVRWIYSLEPQVAQAVSTVPDDQLERFLRLVSQRQVLLVLAESAGVQASPEEWAAAKAQHDSAVSLLRVALRLTPDVVRDSATTPADGAKLASAHVNDYLARVVQGRAQFLLIPPFFSVVLRQHADWKVDQAGVRLALERAKSLRAARDSAAPPPTAPASPMTPATGPAPVPGKP
jgi:hypothetical protein